MKKHLLSLPLLAMLMLLFTGCGDVNYWNQEPQGPDRFYDNRITGCWELYQADSEYITGDAVNYMYFNGDGRGTYFYYDRGYQESERLNYWCQRSVNNASSLQINIDYEYSNPSTMNYWFTNGDRNTLWMQWRNNSGVHTYVYKRVASIPW